MYCHITGLVFWLLFHFNSSKALHKITQKCSCFLFLVYAVFHWSHNWNREWNIIWVNSSLHLNIFNQFQIRFKTRFMTKTPRRADLLPIALSPCPEHFIHQTRMCFLWYWVDCFSLNTNNCSFWKLNNRFWRCYRVFTTMPPRYFVNTMIHRMQNLK